LDIELPYGRAELSINFREHKVHCVVPLGWRRRANRSLEFAIRKPIGPTLRELAYKSRRAVIVTCDKTRGVPSRLTVPMILDELRKAGMRQEQIKVLVATGLHKGETMDDIIERFGQQLTLNLRFEVHDSDDERHLVNLGYLSSGVPLLLNRSVVESDLVIVESTVEPHFFAGFTGGSKVILPGVAGTETVMQNHRPQNIDHPKCRYGVISNPIRDDANEALEHLRRVFAINLVLDSHKKIVYATAGEPIASFNAVANAVIRHSRVAVEYHPDIVVTTNGGYPLDRNVYQCVKGIAVPEQVLHTNSKIIMVGECSDGVAHNDFRGILSSLSPEVLYAKIMKHEIVSRDIWQAQVLCRILRKSEVWFVTRAILRSEIENMHMHFASSVEEALASLHAGKDDRILVVPQGPSTMLHAA
jgi:nickel-dependent lactate racemase